MTEHSVCEALLRILPAVIHADPAWFGSSEGHLTTSLTDLPASVLVEAARHLPAPYACKRRAREPAVTALLSHFSHVRAHLSSLSDADLYSLCLPALPSQCTTICRYTVICAYLELLYGREVASALRRPPMLLVDSVKPQSVNENCTLNPEPSCLNRNDLVRVNWRHLPAKDLIARLSKLTRAELMSCIQSLPPSLRPVTQRLSRRKSCAALVQHVQRRLWYLDSLDDYSFLVAVLSVIPFVVLSTRDRMIADVLGVEYSILLLTHLQQPLLTLHQKQQEARRSVKEMLAAQTVHERGEIRSKWPTVVPRNVALDCLRNYRNATCWRPGKICAVCSRRSQNTRVCDIEPDPQTGALPMHLDLLLLDDAFIIRNCVVQCLSSEFVYDTPWLNGVMLDKAGVTAQTNLHASLHVCADCFSSLSHAKVPRLALANNLYRGHLPDQFRDLTWVEEMVCAIYRNTAHVTRLYQSSDAAQPFILHGNTCAHETNVISTVTVLPRTPADIHGMLSVVFVGPTKLNENALKTMFQVRKKMVWAFLQWLCAHNRLYSHVHLDEDVMNEYPEDGAVPGIANRVIYDHESDVRTVFAEETAGFSEHPAETFIASGTTHNSNDEPSVLLESMGVSDPESSKLSGRAFTASALCNLMPAKPNKPSLTMHRGADAVCEYDNPDLIPGMFPTLFPFGIAGFDDKTRHTPLGFRRQIEYTLDLADRSFRYHRSYMFVTLNIWQRRIAHLHTHFTVRRAHFDTLAKNLACVTATTLTRVAEHLKKEKSYSSLAPADCAALNLLNKVNTVAARIPGSQSSKMHIRNEIRSYFGYFGVPQLYFTCNPNAGHSPIFQVMCGDETVDLTQRYPVLVSARERSLRLARDPVAAADFFQFSVKALFSHLFGWDFDAATSTPAGGILGHLEAFYGTSEFTERGSLHGHFVIWLLGGLNPTELHSRLKDPVYQAQFFAYFEDIIHHHLPDIELDVDPSFEPRTQRPPVPLDLGLLGESPQSVLNEWKSVMATEIKFCGEVLQRHRCRRVCHKYGNDEQCRFLFPHEVVEASYFDLESNSVVLMCRDSTINYFNPYILVFCRHNHDLKSILSGKAAKAAMFYITDYITKMDLKTHELLSLMSRAVSQVSVLPAESDIACAKKLLQKCLSQFVRQQQIHAQQAARYIRGLGDDIPSHQTVPMLSGLLLSFVKEQFMLKQTSGEIEDTEDIEQLSLHVHTDQAGRVITMNQIHHYWFRSDSLEAMSFYDFCRFVRLECKSKSEKMKNTADTRLGVLRRHNLKPGHDLYCTHVLLEHTNCERGEGRRALVPRVVGMNVPRKKSELEWALFTLSHFKPFSASHPLITQGQTLLETHGGHNFDEFATRVMNNWEAVHECEDERDAERLRRRAAITAKSRHLTSTMLMKSLGGDPSDECDAIEVTSNQKRPLRELRLERAISLLGAAGWMQPQTIIDSGPGDTNAQSISMPDEADEVTLKFWKKAIQTQAKVVAQTRQNALNPDEQSTVSLTEAEQENRDQVNMIPHLSVGSQSCAPTESDVQDNNTHSMSEDPARWMTHLEKQFGLNDKQTICFRLICNWFVNKHILKLDTPPLSMIMTGPGGTGKTYVVNAVKTFMARYGCAHLIRFLAPTGSAASLIDGMTIHQGLGIKIKSARHGKPNRDVGNSSEDYTVLVSVRDRTRLRNEWKHVEIVFVDESSMLSLQLICDLDHALRYAKEKPDEYFGGAAFISSGDFYQYPPVGGTPLFSPISTHGPQTEQEILKRLGRLAWKTVDTVVTLTEQQRMKEDPEFGDAVQRLRVRECTYQDVDMFNSRLIRSNDEPHGIDLSSPGYLAAAAIVSTNAIREELNSLKARANNESQPQCLVVCAANDKLARQSVGMSKQLREHLLQLDVTALTSSGSLPGCILLYVGMPVILRSRNLCTDLGVANGSQGIIRRIYTAICDFGFTYCTCALVEFPTSRVAIPGLPAGFFPVTPISWAFTTLPPGSSDPSTKVRVSRNQLPIQPSFAVTGHSAQGKTLPSVIVDLHEGGFGAYVAASRARSREGLCITQPVTIDNLNRPLPYDLLQEMKRLADLEHNTYIRHGFSKGDLVYVLDPESEREFPTKKLRAKFLHGPGASTQRKRGPAGDIPGNVSRPTKVRKIHSHDRSRASATPLTETPSIYEVRAPCTESTAGCTWSETDWSCAYDTVFMVLLYIYRSSVIQWRRSWISLASLNANLAGQFDHLCGSRDRLLSSQEFNKARDHFRQSLGVLSPAHFQTHGQVGASASHILELMTGESACRPHVQTQCIASCAPDNMVTVLAATQALPTICDHNAWEALIRDSRVGNPKASSVSTQAWVNNFFQGLKLVSANAHGLIPCKECGGGTEVRVFFDDPPPLITFEVVADSLPSLLGSSTLAVPITSGLVEYRLRGIIYEGGFHFSARMLDPEGMVWQYDDRVNNGRPSYDLAATDHRTSSSTFDYKTLMALQGRAAHLLIYMLH